MTTSSPTAATSGLSWYERTILRVLRCNTVPNHIAFIMDGNRRYARSLHTSADCGSVNSTDNDTYISQGHLAGYDALLHTLQWCLEVGCQCVTVYAFSTENFKRSATEVNTLMDLAAAKFLELAHNTTLIDRYRICIKFVGNRQHPLLPPKVKHAMQQTEQQTAKYDKMPGSVHLYIAFVYSSSDDMSDSVIRCAEARLPQLQQQQSVKRVTAYDIHQNMQTHELPAVDLLVRTSGEVRLSDFLLYQCTQKTQLAFIHTLWPQINILHFMALILNYQWHHWCSQGVTVYPSNGRAGQHER